VIGQFNVTPRAEHYSRMASRGAFVKTKLHSIHAAAFRLPASAIAKLEKDPDIVYVSPDRTVKLSSTPLRKRGAGRCCGCGLQR